MTCHFCDRPIARRDLHQHRITPKSEGGQEIAPLIANATSSTIASAVISRSGDARAGLLLRRVAGVDFQFEAQQRGSRPAALDSVWKVEPGRDKGHKAAYRSLVVYETKNNKAVKLDKDAMDLPEFDLSQEIISSSCHLK